MFRHAAPNVKHDLVPCHLIATTAMVHAPIRGITASATRCGSASIASVPRSRDAASASARGGAAVVSVGIAVHNEETP